ncbi:MAG: D-alanine--D-alanine ligase [Ruminococcaceae bacterium]|nr:D-alanine--D-alanine ligase [Oscillospiraceae bacterium]
MNKKIDLCIMFGGNSTEYEVSLKSSYSVLSNIDKEKYNIIKVGITRDGQMYLYEGKDENIVNNTWAESTAFLRKALFSTSYGDRAVYAVNSDGTLERVAVDVVFPVMHGAYCEDGRLQGMLDMCGVAYVGPGSASSAVCMDKAFTKMLLENYNIPLAKCVYVVKGQVATEFEAIKADVEQNLGYPVFVKPANSGSSVGVSKARNEAELKNAIENAEKYDGKILIEEAVIGREVEVAVIGNENPIALTCGEIISDADFYDYDDKYNNGTSTSQIPASVKESTWINLKNTAEKIFKCLDCKGLSRVDFFVCGEEEKIVFNEINTLPGFTSISLYPKMAIHSGYTYSSLIDKLIELAIEEKKG